MRGTQPGDDLAKRSQRTVLGENLHAEPVWSGWPQVDAVHLSDEENTGAADDSAVCDVGFILVRSVGETLCAVHVLFGAGAFEVGCSDAAGVLERPTSSPLKVTEQGLSSM